MEETLGRMHTPKDASQTHILVFPTSATAHANHARTTDNETTDIDFFGGDGIPGKEALWARITKNADWSNRPLARSLALLTCSCLLAPHYSLSSRAPLRSLAHLLAHFAYFFARGTVND